MKLNSVQYLRALAAIAVVAYHCITIMNTESSYGVFSLGTYGVDLFFVISGFIMLVTTQKPITPLIFLGKRIRRIVPLYWIVTAVTVVAAIILPSAFRSTVPDVSRVVQSLFFIPHYHAVKTTQIWPIVIQGWTLNYEMFFYLVFAAALGLSLKNRGVIVIVAMLALVAMGRIWPSGNAIWSCYTSPLMIEFCLGVVIGHAYLSKSAILLPLVTGIFAVAGVFFLAAVSLGRGVDVGSVGAAILGGAILIEKRRGGFHNRTILLLGDASYAIYLFHLFGLGMVRFVGGKLHLDWRAPAIDLGTLVIGACAGTLVGVLVYLWVEKPLQAWISSRGQPAEKQPAGA
ncbi:MAG: acyltransferase [Parvibaculaceae bacterium]|nr:acyltransferase [Parvibaculaceae bacterium]